MLKREDIVRRLLRGNLVMDAHTHVGTDPASHRRGDFPYAQSAEDLLVRLDRWRLDAAICFPFVFSAWYDTEALIEGRVRQGKGKRGAAPFEKENENLCREIYEAYPQCGGRLLPFVFFDPAREPAAQAAAAERLFERYAVFGLKTASTYLRAPWADLLSKGQPLMDWAARHNLPVTLHTSVHPDDPWANVADALRVAKARPEIRFCLAHACRFQRAALEAAAEQPNRFVDVSALRIHCELARQNHPAVARRRERFPADYRRPAEVLGRLATAYPNMLLWGSDSPYYCFMSRFTDARGKTTVFALRAETDAEAESFWSLPPPVRERIGCSNTRRYLFGKKAERPPPANLSGKANTKRRQAT